MRVLKVSKRLDTFFTLTLNQINNKSVITKLRVPLSEPVRYHVKQKLRRLVCSMQRP